ncbi:MAG: cell division protein ZapE [Pseudomonadales bacterium]|nr:cell division protein ZapE [Pseudomonadales bacterium]MCP5185370.1 cell division protein ZapE [Pseudomonadales bacterium]
MIGPMERYRQAVSAGEITADPGQAEVMARLDRIYAELLMRSAPPGLLDRVFGRWRRPRPPVRGLYVWGGVGRGKTMLMDLFCASFPEGMAMRMHFHRFMHRVHQDLTRLKGTPNPLQEVAAGLSREGRVLCFDEFFVSDIGDAMLLAELLRGLFERGVTLVATSNVVPDRLYENGLQRSRFLPAIALLKEHADVHWLDGAVDYRLRVLEKAELYHSPLDAEANASLAASFAALAVETPKDDVPMEIEGRIITARRLADDVVWFDFAMLCEGPRSQNDYIELAREFHTVLLSDVPVFTPRREDAARRFISLVDEFYDRSVKLILSAEAGIDELYQGERLRFEFERTRSRLLEMQSQEYLGRLHKA